MRANAKISPTRLPVFSPVRLGHHRHFFAVMPRQRASLVLRRLGAVEGAGSHGLTLAFDSSRRPADARHAA